MTKQHANAFNSAVYGYQQAIVGLHEVFQAELTGQYISTFELFCHSPFLTLTTKLSVNMCIEGTEYLQGRRQKFLTGVVTFELSYIQTHLTPIFSSHTHNVI